MFALAATFLSIKVLNSNCVQTMMGIGVVALTAQPAKLPGNGMERPHMSTVPKILANTQPMSMVFDKELMFSRVYPINRDISESSLYSAETSLFMGRNQHQGHADR